MSSLCDILEKAKIKWQKIDQDARYGSGRRAGQKGAQRNGYFQWSLGILTLLTGLSKGWVLQHAIYISDLTLKTSRKPSKLWKDLWLTESLRSQMSSYGAASGWKRLVTWFWSHVRGENWVSPTLIRALSTSWKGDRCLKIWMLVRKRSVVLVEIWTWIFLGRKNKMTKV